MDVEGASWKAQASGFSSISVLLHAFNGLGFESNGQIGDFGSIFCHFSETRVGILGRGQLTQHLDKVRSELDIGKQTLYTATDGLGVVDN